MPFRTLACAASAVCFQTAQGDTYDADGLTFFQSGYSLHPDVEVAPNEKRLDVTSILQEQHASYLADVKHQATGSVVARPRSVALPEEQWWVPVMRNLGFLQEDEDVHEAMRDELGVLHERVEKLHQDFHSREARYQHDRHSHDGEHFPGVEGGNLHTGRLPPPPGHKPPGMARQLIIPVLALLFGGLCSLHDKARLMGKLFIFFGAQTFMNLYMKAVLSKSLVSQEQGLKGFPAAFCVTALQQLTSFGLLVVIVLLSQITPWAYRPRVLSTPKEFGMLAIFSLCFTLNIALNNFSMSILDISVNLIIRSIAPLTTLLAQMVYSALVGDKSKAVNKTEVLLMIGGVISGLIAVLAKSQGMGGDHKDKGNMILGCVACLFSLFAAAMELILAGVLGSTLKLNPVDTTFYMAIPTAIFLIIPVFFVPHPIMWPGHGSVTDFQIVKEVLALNPTTFGLAVLSGLFALSYNVLLYSVVQTLSAAFSAFTSNFNKAATIALSLLFGFEFLPEQPWGAVMVVGIVGNLGAFTVYGLLKVGLLSSPDDKKKEAALLSAPGTAKKA